MGVKAVLVASLVVGVSALALCEEPLANLLKNPSFEEEAGPDGVPVGWGLYGGLGPQRNIEIVELPEGGRAVRIDDGNDGEEVGLYQTVAAEGGQGYLASVQVKAVEDASPAGSHLQLRFLPSGEFVQTPLVAPGDGKFTETRVGRIAPPGTTHITMYLYTHRDPTPQVIADDVRLEKVEELPEMMTLSGKPKPPVFKELKDLYLETAFVAGGVSTISIVVPGSGIYDQAAGDIAHTIGGLAGVEPTTVRDDAREAGIPLRGHVIVLGNRSTNKLLEALYNRFYTLLDLRYPGPGGCVVRTLHNPFGNGHNAILVGGSDLKGVERATEVFIAELRGRKTGTVPSRSARLGQSPFSIGRLMAIELGAGIEVPTDLRHFEIWDASEGYGSTGYFGWNSISKRMAMYYMTGDEFQAREALRLAFPDEQARQEIADIDGERIENKDHPLSGPYHYNAHMMILFWDLIEESPVFTDEDRLRVTQAFANQLDHHGINAAYVGPFGGPPAHVGSRHGQWTAIALYCLGRYFAKDYDDPVWPVCVENGVRHFASLHQDAWVSGENDNLFWYNTAIAPIFTYLCLTGDRVPLENGVMATLLRGQEILSSGRVPDWALNTASIGFLHKAAYLTRDGRWLHYRDRTGVDVDVFRLGQSFWPGEDLSSTPPTDLVGSWQVNSMPAPMWQWRQNGFELDESYLFMSCRSAPDGAGDYILLDGFNGASRNPYHTFAILELRLDGCTILEGYLNQLRTRADGLTEPRIAMNAALKHRDVLGDTAIAIGEVPDAAFVNWRRAVIQRTGRFALIVDELTPRVDTENLEVRIGWEAKRGGWQTASDGAAQLALVGADDPSALPEGWLRFRAQDTEYTTHQTGEPDLDEKLGVVLMRAREIGAWIEMPFVLAEALSGEVVVDLLNYQDRGVVRIALDGAVLVEEYDHHALAATEASVSLGSVDLDAGTHRLRVETVRKHETNDPCYIALGGMTIKTQQTASPRTPVVCASERMDLRPEGASAVMEWVGPVRKGEPKHFFSLIGIESAGGGAFDCVQAAPNAAALLLPECALAVAGAYEGNDAELLVASAEHLYAKGARRVNTLLIAEAPSDIDWDLATGHIEIAASEPTRLGLALADPEGVTLDAAPWPALGGANELTYFEVPAGRHTIEGALPPAYTLDLWADLLSEQYNRAVEARNQQIAAAAAAAPTLPPLTSVATATFPQPIVDLIQVPSDAGPLLCAAEGQTLHVLNLAGEEVRTLEADGSIRMLRWWDEHRLLLAGCTDEQVIAFNDAGERAWVFVSEMDPAVFRAAKTYWFKSAPGHEGIHGLYTGVFLEGESQAFVGSACTLEILDKDGQLLERMPQFWGKVSTMLVIPGQNDTLNLLTARKYNGTNTVGIINNQTLNPSPRGFYSVPSGHTYMGGWSAMNRHHLFFEDFDGDGAKEVMSEINGTWNRVTVWDANGAAKYDASFGPGKRIPAKFMRDIDVADLTGDGVKDIVVATAGRMLVALTGKCEKLWATRLDATPTVMNCIAPADASPPWIVIGYEDGRVEARDHAGALRYSGNVTGAPTTILPLPQAAGGPVMAFGTSKGELALLGFAF